MEDVCEGKDFSFPAQEDWVLKLRAQLDAFQEQLRRTEGGEEFVFYDGPPVATGLPHYGHILAGTIKDVVARHQSMPGRHVSRRFGWDCHGLPVEFEADEAPGITSGQQVFDDGSTSASASASATAESTTRRAAAAASSSPSTRTGRQIESKNGDRDLISFFKVNNKAALGAAASSSLPSSTSLGGRPSSSSRARGGGSSSRTRPRPRLRHGEREVGICACISGRRGGR